MEYERKDRERGNVGNENGEEKKKKRKRMMPLVGGRMFSFFLKKKLKAAEEWARKWSVMKEIATTSQLS